MQKLNVGGRKDDERLVKGGVEYGAYKPQKKCDVWKCEKAEERRGVKKHCRRCRFCFGVIVSGVVVEWGRPFYLGVG